MSCNLMGDCNMDHMLDVSRRGHVRRHVLLDFGGNGKNTKDGQNMTQEPGAQENCDKLRLVQTHSYVLWDDKLPGDIPRDDEHHLCQPCC
jgi:hypothetical protein